MKIIIEKDKNNMFNVTVADKNAHMLGYDEMLGLLTMLTMPENRRCLSWLKTKEEHEQYKEYIENIKPEIVKNK